MTPPDPPSLLLDEQLCVALHSASRAMTGCYRTLLRETGLSYSQYTVMLVLWERGAIRVGELCALLHLDSGTLSPLLTRLQARGLVERHRPSDDARTVRVELTEDGRRLRERVAGVPVQVEHALGLDRAELAALRDDLTALAGRLRAAYPSAS